MDSIGKYTLLGPLGRGGMGVVYRARDPVIGREVALKMIVDQAVADPAVRRRFLAEAQRAGSLNHPNIVTIYDVGEDDGRPFIVMEILSGDDLRHVLDGARELPLAERVDIAVQAARGLAFAHRNGVLHRDVKPDNVFVTDTGVVKVLDFGIARLESDMDTVTQAAVGTPRYMSPEQIRGEAVDRRTDVYSFGVLLYELIGGATPFEGTRVHTVMHKVLHEAPPPVPLPDGAPQALRAVVARCLEKDADARFDSLDEAADALRQAMGTGAAPAVHARSRRSPVLAGVAVVAVVAVVAAVWAMGSRSPDAEAVAERPAALAVVDTAGVSTSTASDTQAVEPVPLVADAALAVQAPAPAPIPVLIPQAPAQVATPPPPRSEPTPPPTAAPVEAPPPRPAPAPVLDTSAADRQQAGAALDRLARALAAGMVAQDVAALQRVHPFYAQMGAFFPIADDVQATATPSGLALDGDRASATVVLAFSFANTTQNHRRESQRVTYAWTLARAGSGWALADVAAR
ncbi:serine/threonine-protein kinase [Rubrivirga sp. IMCC45206]|uniref:serine/threonine-protein kinase n=1 Tax=Rubrivirga sp. IMCC45206 TaxID=3391614 RepID=UPI00398FA601